MKVRAIVAVGALLGTIAAAPPVRIAVNDRPLDVLGIESHGHVLVPVRAIFEALGATVRYSGAGRTIVAATNHHRVVLSIGAIAAQVDGRSISMDVPPQVVAARTYVPLRFVSVALGADVAYDATTRIANVFTERSAATAPVGVIQRYPLPNAQAGTAYPIVTAVVDIPRGDSIRTLRFSIDGTDVSNDATFEGAALSYVPRFGLQPGTHTVELSGETAGGIPFAASWSFETNAEMVGLSMPGMPEWTVPGYAQYLNFSVGGRLFRSGGAIPVWLQAPPNGEAFAFTCLSSWRYQLFSTSNSAFYSATLSVPTIASTIAACPISVMYVGWNGEVTYAPYPVFVTLQANPTPPAPGPTATPPYRQVPPPIRRTPAPVIPPVPLPSVKPLPVPRITTKPVASPMPSAKPQPRATQSTPRRRSLQ